MQRLLIAGCGDIGIHLGKSVAAHGVEVFGLRRNPSAIPAPIHPLTADLTDSASLARVLPECLDAAIYIATPGRFEDTAYRLAYVEGLRNLLATLDASGQRLRRLVFVSSTSVYGVTDGSWVDEDTPAEPAGFSGARLREAERLLERSPHDNVVVRFGGIYGPGRERMLRRVREGRPVVDTPPQYTNRIHRDDCSGVLAHLLNLDDPASLYLAVDDHPCPMAELTDWLADTMKLPRPPHVSGDAGGIRGSNKRCSNRRLRASGFEFRYPDYRAGYRQILGT